MRLLLAALQLVIGYLVVAISFGMINSNGFNALEVFVAVAFFVGLLLITVLVPRLFRQAKSLPSLANRAGVSVLLCFMAVGLGAVAQGVLVGVWRGPSRLASLHQLSVHFAGTWMFAAVFILMALLCLAYATKALPRAEV